MRKGITAYEHGSRKVTKQIQLCRMRCAGETAVAVYRAYTHAECDANVRAVIRAEFRAEICAEIHADGRAVVGAEQFAEKWQRCRNELQN